MKVDVVRTCPLGGVCERVIDGRIERCMWQVEIKGRDPQTGEHVDKKDCSMAVMPILLVQSTAASIQIASATDSARNVLFEGFKRVRDIENKRLGDSGSQ